MAMPDILRPGSIDTSAIGYDTYLQSTEAYKNTVLAAQKAQLERTAQQSSNVRRPFGQTSSVQRGLEGQYNKEAKDIYGIQAKELAAIDRREYSAAQAAKPILDTTGSKSGPNVYTSGEAYNKALSDWVNTYKNVLGRGESRYQTESSFVTQAQTAAQKQQVYDEINPYGLYKPVDQILNNLQNYDILSKYESGAPKVIASKETTYTSAYGPLTVPGIGKYRQYEVTLSESGKPIEEKTRDIRKTVYDSWGKQGWQEFTEPYVKATLLYNESGIPQKLNSYLGYKTGTSTSGSSMMSYYGVRPDKIVEIDPSMKVLTKTVYDDALRSQQIKPGDISSSKSYQSYIKDSYDYNKGESISFPQPIANESSYAPLRATPRTKGTTLSIFNPYTGIGYMSGGQTGYNFMTQPTLSPVKGPTSGLNIGNVPKQTSPTSRINVIPNPMQSNKWMRFDMNPTTNKQFQSQQELDYFWGSRNARIGSVIMDQQFQKTASKGIPKSVFGTSSQTYGMIDTSGKVQKTPGDINFENFFR